MKVLIHQREIKKRVRVLAKLISKNYKGQEVIFVGVLKGSVPFLADLIKEVDLKCKIDFVSVSSYQGQESSGVVKLQLDLRESIENKHVIIVEDIVDTGLTLNYLLNSFKTRNPKSLEVCTLLDKPSCRKIPVQAKYTGFSIPNKFVVGYGLDLDEYYRNLPYVGVFDL